MGALRNLIQSVIPNFSDKQLRSMVPWFLRVSEGIDNGGTLIAGAHINSGGTFERRFGFTTTLGHPSTGNYVFTFTETQDTNSLILLANVTGQATPAGAIIAYPNLQDTTSMVVNVWQIAATTSVRSQVDADFFVLAFRAPEI